MLLQLGWPLWLHPPRNCKVVDLFQANLFRLNRRADWCDSSAEGYSGSEKLARARAPLGPSQRMTKRINSFHIELT